MIRLDTHVVAWLAAGERARLSTVARAAIQEHDPCISPMVELELTFLHEIGRLDRSGPAIVADLAHRIGMTASDVHFSTVVADATGLSWTRDPFDRLIVADASAAGASLVTRDERIREHYDGAVW